MRAGIHKPITTSEVHVGKIFAARAQLLARSILQLALLEGVSLQKLVAQGAVIVAGHDGHSERELHRPRLHARHGLFDDGLLGGLHRRTVHLKDDPACLHSQVCSVAFADLADRVLLNVEAKLADRELHHLSDLDVVALELRLEISMGVELSGLLRLRPLGSDRVLVGGTLFPHLCRLHGHARLRRSYQLGSAIVVRGGLSNASRALALGGAHRRGAALCAQQLIVANCLLDRLVHAKCG
mmetsp:Transcript_79463/g.233556  ORF Transcript_79463/g.233556 Transcript_79463/m.233556 type:complete len:240 (+) Transcript_79463:136-855(+)